MFSIVVVVVFDLKYKLYRFKRPRPKEPLATKIHVLLELRHWAIIDAIYIVKKLVLATKIAEKGGEYIDTIEDQ